MEKHLECLKKPLSLNDTHLYHTYITCRNLGLVINNYLFKKIPNRTVENDYWLWKYKFYFCFHFRSWNYPLFVFKINIFLKVLDLIIDWTVLFMNEVKNANFWYFLDFVSFLWIVYWWRRRSSKLILKPIF